MTKRRIRHPASGEIVEAEVVEIVEEENEAITLKLEDGAVLRF